MRMKYFVRLLKIIDLSVADGRSVALTATTGRHREVLEGRSNAGERFAQAVVDELNNYLGRPVVATERGRKSEGWTRSELAESPVSVADYAPSQFENYRAALVASRDLDLTARVQEWLAHWRTQGKGVEALDAVVQARAKSYGIKNLLWKEFRDQMGREAAFPWLVEAQKGGGWNERTSEKSDSEERWRAIARDYPDKWFDFLKESLIELGREGDPEATVGHGAWPRIVAFLLVSGQRDLAEKSVEAIVDTTLDLVSAGDLGPEPSWLRDCSTPTEDVTPR